MQEQRQVLTRRIIKPFVRQLGDHRNDLQLACIEDHARIVLTRGFNLAAMCGSHRTVSSSVVGQLALTRKRPQAFDTGEDIHWLPWECTAFNRANVWHHEESAVQVGHTFQVARTHDIP